MIHAHIDAKKRHQARMVALQALYQWQSTALSPEEIKNFFPHPDEWTPECSDLPYLNTLVLEVPRHCEALDEQFKTFLDRPIAQLNNVELALLRMATFELLHTDTPSQVVLNEAIELAKTFGAAESYKFINGILDQVSKSNVKE